jgi:CheY-like chemotaxis protein
LDRLGIEADAVNDGKDAVSVIEHNSNGEYAAIFMDCIMPGKKNTCTRYIHI